MAIQYQSYGKSRRGRFKQEDAGYGALTELRRRDSTSIEAAKKHSLQIERQQKEWLSHRERADAKEITNLNELRDFDRKVEDFAIQNTKAAANKIEENGRKEAEAIREKGKLLASLSESAFKFGAAAYINWKKAEEMMKEDAGRDELDSPDINDPEKENQQELVKTGIDNIQKRDDGDQTKQIKARQNKDENQSITSLNSQSSIFWNLMGFGHKNIKFENQIHLASENAELAWEEYKADNTDIDFSDKEVFNKSYNKWAEGYLREKGAWYSQHPKAVELRNALIRKKKGINLNQAKARNTALVNDIIDTKLSALDSDVDAKKLARTIGSLQTLNNPETGIPFTAAEARGRVFNYLAPVLNANPEKWQGILNLPAGRLNDKGEFEPHRTGRSWFDAYPLEAKQWLELRQNTISVHDSRAQTKASARDHYGLKDVTGSIFAQQGSENYEGSLAEARDKQLAEPGSTYLEDAIRELKTEHAGNPKTLEFIQKFEHNLLQSRDTATVEQWAKKLHEEGKYEDLADFILGIGEPAKQKELAAKYLPWVQRAQEAGLSWTKVQKQLQHTGLTLLKRDTAISAGTFGSEPITLELWMAEANRRYGKYLKDAFAEYPDDPSKAVRKANEAFQKELKDGKNDEDSWTYVSTDTSDFGTTGQAYFKNLIGVREEPDHKPLNIIVNAHKKNPTLYKEEYQHSIKTLLPIATAVKTNNFVRVPQEIKDAARELKIPLREYLAGQLNLLNRNAKTKEPIPELQLSARDVAMSINPAGTNWLRAVEQAKDLAELRGLALHAVRVNNGAQPSELTRPDVASQLDPENGSMFKDLKYSAAVKSGLNAVLKYAETQGYSEGISIDDIITPENSNEINVLNGKNIIHVKPDSRLWDALTTATNSKGKRLFKNCFVTDPEKVGAYSRPTCFKRN